MRHLLQFPSGDLITCENWETLHQAVRHALMDPDTELSVRLLQPLLACCWLMHQCFHKSERKTCLFLKLLILLWYYLCWVPLIFSPPHMCLHVLISMHVCWICVWYHKPCHMMYNMCLDSLSIAWPPCIITLILYSVASIPETRLGTLIISKVKVAWSVYTMWCGNLRPPIIHSACKIEFLKQINVSSVVQSSNPVQWSCPLNRYCWNDLGTYCQIKFIINQCVTCSPIVFNPSSTYMCVTFWYWKPN